LALDIGANAGQCIEQELYLFDRVMAFEPAEESFELLFAYCEEHRHTDRLFARQLALGAEVGELALVALPDKISTGQLVSYGAQGMEYDPAAPEGQVRTVPCTTVDALVLEQRMAQLEFVSLADVVLPDFLKIDTEGHEVAVLQGAEDTLNELRPQMLIEVHSETNGRVIDDILEDYDYRYEVIRHPYYEEFSPLWKTHYWMRCFPM
jgi:FkbM family methyltransferase